MLSFIKLEMRKTSTEFLADSINSLSSRDLVSEKKITYQEQEADILKSWLHYTCNNGNTKNE